MRKIVIFLYLIFGYGNQLLYANENNKEKLDIYVVTEDTFPLQYVENKKITGPATQLVKKVLSTAKLKYNITVMPWSEAYQLALKMPNVLIYSMGLTQERKAKFIWLGKIKSLEYYLYGNDNLPINNDTPIRTLKKYRVGAVRKSATEHYLVNQGFKQLVNAVDGKQNILLFEKDRIDLFPYNRFSFLAICEKYQFNCKDAKPLYKLDLQTIDLYMAASLSTDEHLIKKIRSAYQKVIQNIDFLENIGLN